MKTGCLVACVAMAIDTRDWYRDWWRKKTGYVERARFRMGNAEYLRYRRAKALRTGLKLVTFLTLLAMLAAGVTQSGTVGRWLHHHFFALKSLIPWSTFA